MNVNEVKKAQQIIRSAKIDLALIVKKYFESGNPLMVNDLKPFDCNWQLQSEFFLPIRW